MKWLVLVGTVVIGLTSAQDCPSMVNRTQWGAKSPRSRTRLSVTPVPLVVIHHAACNPCTTQANCSLAVRNIQMMHMDPSKKPRWADIGYNFLVGEDGNVYEGRGWTLAGSHAPNYNNRSLGICVIGNFVARVPNSAALSALTKLIKCGVSQGRIKTDYSLVGHRQVKSTECPGAALYEHITTWERWRNNTDV